MPPAPFHHSLHHALQQAALSEQPRPLGTGTRGESRSGGPQRWTNAAIEWQRWQWRRHQGPIPDAPQSPDNRRSPKLARLEAVLFVADGPLTLRRLIDLATLADAAEARQLINDLNEGYEHDGTAFRVERVASGYQMLTLPVFADWLDRLHQRHAALKLSAPAMETLTIVAYRQPIIRADIEAIRGVQSTEMLKQLMERGLVRIGGEDDSLGRPYLYVTTRKFLEIFGLKSLDDLPMAESLRRPAQESSTPQTVPDADAAEEQSDDSGGDAEDDADIETAPDAVTDTPSDASTPDTFTDRDAAA